VLLGAIRRVDLCTSTPAAAGEKTFSAGPISPELCTFGQRYGSYKAINIGIFEHSSKGWSLKGIRLVERNRERLWGRF
jgi:hypothetical protein